MPVAIPPGACTTRIAAASSVTPSCEKANTVSDFLKICTTRFASTAVGQKMSWRNGERSSRSESGFKTAINHQPRNNRVRERPQRRREPRRCLVELGLTIEFPCELEPAPDDV